MRYPGVRTNNCTVEAFDTEGGARHGCQVWFELPLDGVAELQAVALYAGDVCLGGGTIRERGPSLLDEARGITLTGWSGQRGGGADAVESYVIG